MMKTWDEVVEGYRERWIEIFSHGVEGFSEQACREIVIAMTKPKPKTGKWIKRFDGNEWFWYCSACKEQWYEDDLYMGGNEFPNFCPNCGADMRGEQDEDQ